MNRIYPLIFGLLFSAIYGFAQCDIVMEVSVTNVTCFGSNDGTATAEATNGTPPYDFHWDNGFIGPSVSGLSAGLYEVTVTDDLNCTETTMFEITEPDQLIVSIFGPSSFCEGESVTLLTDVTGGTGTANTSYLWSSGETTSSLSIDYAGVFVVTVTDIINGCSATEQFTVTEIPLTTPTLTPLPDLCQLDASVSLPTTQDGIIGQWTGPGVSNNIFDPAGLSGEFILTFTPDPGQCAIFSTTTIIIQAAITPNLIPLPNLCQLDASINLPTTQDGIIGQWTGPGVSNNIFDPAGLTGEFILTFTPVNGQCANINTMNIIVEAAVVPNPPSAGPFCEGSIPVPLPNVVDGINGTWSGVGVSANYFNPFGFSGTVILTFTPDAGECALPATIDVIVYDFILPTIIASGDLCTNGSITLSVDPNYSEYLWNTNETTQTIDVSAPGVYTVTVTEELGSCFSILSYEVLEVNLSPTIVGSTVICPGSSTILDAGNDYSFYLWNDNSDNQTLQVSVAGNYSVTVTDDNGCTGTDQISITESQELQPMISGDLFFCEGSFTTLDAGAGFSTYLWNTNVITPTIPVNQAGNYSVTVTDIAGCSGIATVTVLGISEVEPVISGALIFCEGGNSTLDAGSGFAAYVWNTSETTQTIDVYASGNYFVTVTDNNGCTGIAGVSVFESSNLDPMIVGAVVFCEGASTTLNVGNGFDTYSWSTSETTQSILVSDAGDYSVTVSDSSGCTGVDEITVFELPELQPAISGALSFCEGENTTLNAGNGFDAYVWSTAETTSSINVSEAGTYIVTVSDANGCTGMDEVTVVTTPPDIPILDDFGPHCVSDGSVLLSTIQSGYTGTWSGDGVTGNMFDPSGLVGTSILTFTPDFGQCADVAILDVEVFAELQINISMNGALCEGGSVTLEATPGFADYIWISPNGPIVANTNILEATDPGEYLLMVNNGVCSTEAIIVVEENLLAVSPEVSLPSDCDVSDGSIEMLSTGTAMPHTYLWSTGSTSALIDNLTTGTYSCTITDDVGCTIVETVNLPSFSVISGSTSIDNLNCNGDTNGSILVTADDGTPPYNFQWSNGASTAEITNLSAGDYTVTITDAVIGSCPFVETYTISEPSSISIMGTTIPVTCSGAADGQIGLLVSGGIPDYTFLWNDNSTTKDRVNLVAGVYIVTVTDSNNCTAVSDPFQINESPNLEISTPNDLEITCITPFVTIDISVTGGIQPYTYFWANGDINEDITVSEPGTYLVTVADDNGCFIVSDEIVVTLQPMFIEVNAISVPETCTEGGSISIEASGGVPPYSYLWNNGATTDFIENLSSGIYSVIVTDVNSCQVTDTVFVEPPIDVEVSSTFADCDQDNGTATATLLGGTTNPVFSWSNGGSGETQTDLAPGFYSVTVMDGASDCETHENVEVEKDPDCTVIISGFVYVDQQLPDCIVDGTTLPAGNIMVQLSDGQTTFTNSDGYYEFTSDTPDAYAITLLYNDNLYEGLCVDPIVVNALTYGEHYDQNNFYFQYDNTIQHDIKLKVSKENARPGFDQRVRICLMNVGPIPVSGTLTYVHDEIQSYEDANPDVTNYDEPTRTFSWDYENIPPGAVWIYKAYVYTPTTTALGTELEYLLQAEPINGDFTPDNNEIYCTMEVTGSYDPNDKQVTPTGVGEDGIISMADSLLSYHIRFQNTGTDTAFTVVIRDQLDEDLDLTTVVPGPASHTYSLDVLDGNILEFTFENIMLPDSNVNEEASHGFVFFDVETRSGLPYGTVIENTAGIYFDFNLPIITNTVSNIIQMIVPTVDLNEQQIIMSVAPNPLSQNGYLKYELSSSEEVKIDLLDLNGRIVETILQSNRQAEGTYLEEIDMAHLPAGVYYINLQTISGQSVIEKVVKME